MSGRVLKVAVAVGAVLTVGLTSGAARNASGRTQPDAASSQRGSALATTGTDAVRPAASRSWRLLLRTAAGPNTRLNTVTAVGKRDAWAAGYAARGALVYHWNGRAWRRAAMPGGAGFFPVYSSGTSPRDVWILGYTNSSNSNGQIWLAKRWNGSAWVSQPLPDATGFTGLRMLGPADAWLVGMSSCEAVSKASSCTTPLWRWNGHVWHAYTVGTDVSSIAGSSPRNVWVVGYLPLGSVPSGLRSRPYAYRWNGRAWKPVRMPHPLCKGAPPGIDTSSARNVWIGTWGVNHNPKIGGVGIAMHWNGRKWREVHGLLYTPVIDEPLGVWFPPNVYLSRNGEVFVPGTLDGYWADVVRIPGTTSLFMVGVRLAGAKSRGFIGAWGRLP